MITILYTVFKKLKIYLQVDMNETHCKFKLSNYINESYAVNIFM